MVSTDLSYPPHWLHVNVFDTEIRCEDMRFMMYHIMADLYLQTCRDDVLSLVFLCPWYY